MKKIVSNRVKVLIYTDPIEYSCRPEQPLGELPEGAIYAGIIDEHCQTKKSTGFAMINANTIVIFSEVDCDFEDLFSNVSHELGHLIEGGFKNNPPQKPRYDKKHEEKAMHYESFALHAYRLTTKIISHLK